MKKTLISFIFFAFCIVMTSCEAVKEKEYNIAQDENIPQKLVVYLSAPEHGFQRAENSENIEYFYPSKYTVGTRLIGGDLDSSGGNIFEQALLDYSKQTGIEIEIHYLEEHSQVDDVLQELYEKDDLPDMVILNKHSQYDYNLLALKGLLLDFTPYIEDELHDDSLYYQKVLESGKIQDKQCILPVLFNMNGIISSESYLSSVLQEEIESISSYQDVILLLEESCIAMENMQEKEAIFETSGLMSGGLYIPSILTGAACTEYFDEDILNVKLSQKTIQEILEVMNLYNRQEFGIDPNWEEKTYVENLNNLDIMSRSLVNLNLDTYKYVGIFLSGGRSGGLNLHNSLMLDVAYFNSMYNKDEEDMVFWGIPTEDDPNAFSANISVLATGFSSTEYPEAVYKLARYMMDYEYPMSYGFSTNKEITENQLEMIQKTTINLYPDAIWSSVTAGVKNRNEIKNEIEILEPLTGEHVEKIQYMLDNIAGAGLPCGFLEHTLYLSALHKIGNGEMSCSEASEWIIESLQGYLKMGENLEPFYDKEFIQYMLDSR